MSVTDLVFLPMPSASERTQVKRLPQRGHYDRQTIDAILDEAFVCHVGIVVDGSPIVMPTLHARLGNHLLLHGSPASRFLRAAPSQDVCITVTLVDGFVLARSAFHHSVNYRSVILFGRPEKVEGAEKSAALDAIVEQLVPGRVESLRPMTPKEIAGTTVLRIRIDEASAKVREGWPIDDEEDYDFPVWAGLIPVTTVFGEPQTDPSMRMEIEVPECAADYRRPQA